MGDNSQSWQPAFGWGAELRLRGAAQSGGRAPLTGVCLTLGRGNAAAYRTLSTLR